MSRRSSAALLPPDPIGPDAIRLLHKVRAHGGVLSLREILRARASPSLLCCYQRGFLSPSSEGCVALTSAGKAYLDWLARAH